MPADELKELETFEKSETSRWIGWSSLGFAALQSVCLALVSISGLRTAIGLSSLLVAGGIWPALQKFHSDAIRVPMMIFATAGAVANLLVLWQMHRLRARPSAAWRRREKPLLSRRAERIQIILSCVTLVLVVVEFFLHRYLHPY